MISLFNGEEIKEINNLGSEINPNFTKLFNVDNLPNQEKIYVYKEDNKIVGFIHILINIDTLEILNLVIKAEKRNQGIAQELIDHLLSNLSDNIKKIILEVRKSNLPAINLYSKFNFFIISERTNYYGDEDAIIMERSCD